MHLSSIHTTILFPFSFFFFFSHFVSGTFCFLFACVTISSQKVYACNLYFFFSIGIGYYYCTTNDFFLHIPLFHFITFPLLILSVSKNFVHTCGYTFHSLSFLWYSISSMIFFRYSWFILDEYSFFFLFFLFSLPFGLVLLRSFFFLSFFLSFFGWNVIFFFFSESLKKKLL